MSRARHPFHFLPMKTKFTRLALAAFLSLALAGCGHSEVNTVKAATVPQDSTHTSARSIQSEQYGPVDVFHQCTDVGEPLVEFETHYVFRRDNMGLLSRSRLRFMSAGELAIELNASGFGDIEWFGDWTGTPFHETSSSEIIAICHA